MAGLVGGVARGLLAYAVAVAVLATLSPFDFQRVPGRGMAVLVLADDVLRNLLLLFPAGFLYALSAGKRLGRGALPALGLGLALALAVELGQLFLPSRHSNVIDVLANGAGAWAGALAAQQLGHRLESALSEELLLELPLTGSLYLLAPLLMVHGLAAYGWRPLSIVSLGLFAAPIVAALYRERVARTAALSEARFTAYAALAFAGAALPALLRWPPVVALAAVALATGTWVTLRLAAGAPVAQRRFEARTAARALPWFLLYVMGLAPRFSGPSGGLVLAGNQAALAVVEACAAFTLLGYLLGELTSRARVAAGWRAVVALMVGASIGAFLQLSRSAGGLGGLLQPLLMGASCAAGDALHAAQVRLVQALRERRTEASTKAMASASSPP
jgi:VanZ family protein